MTQTLTVLNAEIKTANVEIKAIMVNHKQVTLSVFRQVQRESLIDEDCNTFNGIPWGTVNYFWPGNEKFSDGELYLHVLWQKGNELRRDLVRRHKQDYMLKSLISLKSNHMRFFKNCPYGLVALADLSCRYLDELDYPYLCVDKNAWRNVVEYDPEFFIPKQPIMPYYSELEKDKESYMNKMKSWRSEINQYAVQQRPILIKEAQDAYDNYKKYIDEYNSLISEIALKPQLFIAI